MDLLRITVEPDPVAPVAVLEGELDMSNVRDAAASLIAGMSNQALGLILDLGGLLYLDSSAMKMLFDLRDRLTGRGQQLCIVIDGSTRVADALRIGGVSAAIPVVRTRDEGRSCLTQGVDWPLESRDRN